MANASDYATWEDLETDLWAAIPAPVVEEAAPAAPAVTVWGTPAVAPAIAVAAEPTIEPPADDAEPPPMDASCTVLPWTNPDITALTALPACPSRFWVTSVGAPTTTAETKAWAVSLVWYRGVEDAGWSFTEGSVTLHFHPVPTSPNYLHLKRTDAALPTTGIMTNNHWLVAKLGIDKADVTPA